GADSDLGLAKPSDVGFIEMDGVDRRRIWTADALPFEELGGRAPLDLEAFVNFRRLLGEMDVQRRVPLARIGGHDPHGLRVYRADAVDGRADAHAVGIVQLLDPPHPAVRVAV